MSKTPTVGISGPDYEAIYRNAWSDALKDLPSGIGAWQIGARAVANAALEHAATLVEAHEDWKEVRSALHNAAFLIRCGKYGG